MIPYLARILETHIARLGMPTSGPLFPATNGKPVGLNNVLGRVILPALKANAHSPRWHGWHAFRRGLATNLHELGSRRYDDPVDSQAFRCEYYAEVLHQVSTQAVHCRNGSVTISIVR